MDKINKYQTGVILLSVITGLLLGHINFVADYSAKFIVPLLMVMLFGLFLTINISELKSSFLNVKFSLTSIIINFVWTPILAYILGYIFLTNELPIWIGFVMLMVTPCTDWYLVFTGVAKGNVPLSTSILPVNLILQVLLLPVYLMLFFGKSGNVELSSLVESILLVLVVPFVLALIAKKTIGKNGKTGTNLIQFFEKSQVLFLALAVVAMFTSEGKNLIDNPDVIYKLLIPVLIFFAVTFALSQLVSKLLKFSYADKVSLVLTTMARNSPISLAIAVSAFSSEPLIALSLVIGPLIELPILVLTSQVLLKTGRNLQE
ncbi:arsenic resistance protein [Sphingobacterium daejeonense]|jgi:ACR3 family arsenite transporter|uniref:Arsenic resistance protein n=1 Tax=Sphingobacterium daejeonense TaxID=371142 RepID=A0ABW3RR49_9SPHI